MIFKMPKRLGSKRTYAHSASKAQTVPKPNAASLSLPGRFPNDAVRARNADIRLDDRKLDVSPERSVPFTGAPSLSLPTSTSYPLAPSSERPLDRRRIIVTGPRQYASKLCGLLVDAGAKPLWVPCIEISAVEDPAQLEELHNALENLSSYTYVAFTSKNGVHAFLHELEVLKGAGAQEYVKQSGVHFCALGVDAQVLESAGYDVHVQPEEPSTQGLVREMDAKGLLDGASVLCPVPHVTGGLIEPSVVPRFVAALQEGGADVTRVPAYITTQGVSSDDVMPEAALMRGGCVDAICFTSSAEAQGLVNALGGLDVLQALLSDHDIVLAAHGPYTAAGVAAVTDMEVAVIGSAFGSFHGIVNALSMYFDPHTSSSSES